MVAGFLPVTPLPISAVARSVRRSGEVTDAEDCFLLVARLVLTGERTLGRAGKTSSLNRHRAAVALWPPFSLMAEGIAFILYFFCLLI